jgi:hypothetical protein
MALKAVSVHLTIPVLPAAGLAKGKALVQVQVQGQVDQVAAGVRTELVVLDPGQAVAEQSAKVLPAATEFIALV